MSKLRDLQRAFGACLLAEDGEAVRAYIVEDGFSADERLRIYRNTCRSTLMEALRLTYPAVDRLVGSDFFDMAAARFIAAHPSRSGYLNEYGAEFAEAVAERQSATTLAYLADVARFEWALSVAANAMDAPVLDPDAFAAVAPALHASLVFEPHPSVSVLALAYPADQIADAVLSGDEAAMAQIDLSSGPVRVIVHRGASGVEVQRLEADAYRFVSRLCCGEALGTLLETAPPAVSTLLAEQFAKRRLTAFRVGTERAIESEARS